MIEVYVDGIVALSYRIYGPATHELGFFVENGTLNIENVNIKRPMSL
jgi:hypothetical protein